MKQKFISGRNNALIAEICKLKQKKYRNRTGLFYVEGVKLLKEALSSEYKKNIKYIIAEENIAGEIAGQARNDGGFNDGWFNFDITVVTTEVYKKITDEEAFQGVMCVLEKPGKAAVLSYEKPVVILSSVRDPGNIGTIIRTAYAICDIDIILSDDCADIYSGKTQRAAMGAVFRQNIKISENLQEDIENLKKKGYNIIAAHLDKNSRRINDVKFNSKTAVIFGNEGTGIDNKTAELCDEKMIIPINKNSESLNVSVAAGIVLWEMGKRKI